FHLSAAVQNLSTFIVLYNDTKSLLLKGESLYFIYRLAMVLTGPEPAAATAPGNLRRNKL
ncbi:TPA: hypothetical protein ACGPFL_004381, partial [Enterobacter hormaechei]